MCAAHLNCKRVERGSCAIMRRGACHCRSQEKAFFSFADGIRLIDFIVLGRSCRVLHINIL